MNKYCVIGHPINHSKSPALHQAGFVDLEIDAEFEAIDVNPDHLDSWVKFNFRPHFQGAAVTIPHKTEILKYVDNASDSALQIGAANTLYWQEGQLVATNTDGIGALKALQTQVDELDKKNVLILGAGGASRAIIFALKVSGANVALWNRSVTTGQQVAEHFEIPALETLDQAIFQAFDVIINTTSVGLKEWQSVVPADYWKAGQVAFDIVYDPLETRFLSEASDAGAATVTGDLMLVYQALEQFKLWHGVELEPEVMMQAFLGE